MRYVAYLRVSTARQGQSGLGLEAQERAVRDYLASHGGEIIQTFVEVETGKGFNPLNKRPQLRAALQSCRSRSATLLIAKLDRLARNCAFVSGLLETGCEFIAADMPQANKTMIQIYAAMSEWERDQNSARTKAALAAAKARGVRLGVTGPQNLRANLEERKAAARAFVSGMRGVIDAFQVRGLTTRQMIDELNQAGSTTPRGRRWALNHLRRLIARLDASYDSTV
jgi:DNA invertase Pin-like site-specific DNA recombinase